MSKIYITKSPDIGKTICRSCLTPLFYETVYGRTGYIHSSDRVDDHFPQPIPEAESLNTLYLCDFCSAFHLDNELGTVWTKKIITDDMSFSPDWSVCNSCLTFIEADEWNNIIERYFILNPKHDRVTVTDWLTPLLAQVKEGMYRIEYPVQRQL